MGAPKHALIVLAHPEPKSFNAQMKDVARDALSHGGRSVMVSDLHALDFDPVESPKHFANRADVDWFRPQIEQRHAADTNSISPDIQTEIDKVLAADVLILQYPMWWFGMPAILKGWFDRVFTYGATYTSTMRYDAGRFRGKRALISVTTGGPKETFRPDGRNGDIDLLMWPTCFSLHFVGYSVLRPFVSYGVEAGIQYSPIAEMMDRLQLYKEKYEDRLAGMDHEKPMEFNGWNHWDRTGRLKPDAPSFSLFMRHADSVRRKSLA